MKNYKFFSIKIILSFFLFILSTSAYIHDFRLFQHLNQKIIDFFLVARGPLLADSRIIIIDIDEKSLNSLGQWPWSRDKVAQILENLTKADVGIIGLDIVFAEEDSSSPDKILNQFGFHHKDALNFDTVLAATLQTTPIISGYLFNFDSTLSKGDIPNIPSIIVQKNKPEREFIPEAQGIITNIHVLQNNTFSSGFFNTIPDSDGIVRSVPLVVKYQNKIFPSLALEMVRLVYGSNQLTLHYNQFGLTSIDFKELSIPTDRFGRLQINYMGESKHYVYLSALDVYNNQFDTNLIQGKIALLGTSADGLLDLRATPLDSTFPGVEVHATTIDNIINKTFIKNPQWMEAVDIMIMLCASMSVVIFFTFFGAIKTAFLFLFLLVGYVYCAYHAFVSHGIILNVMYPVNLAVVLYIVLVSLHYFVENKQKELIRTKLAKKVSSAVAEDLIRYGNEDILEAREKEVTIFFSDIRGFTSISEAFESPKKLIEFLNLYMTPMTEIIIHNGGTVDKFMGDAIMAYWNAPNDILQHADCAVQSAIEQIGKLKQLNISLKSQGLPEIDIGIGINTGIVVVGEMGSAGRSDYTIIGDNVNVASRIESLCKIYQANIIISENTKKRLKHPYSLRYLDDITVKGKVESIKIYEVILDSESNALLRGVGVESSI